MKLSERLQALSYLSPDEFKELQALEAEVERLKKKVEDQKCFIDQLVKREGELEEMIRGYKIQRKNQNI